MVFGRTDAKAEAPILWPPQVKSWFIGKDSDAGRDWGQEEKGTTEDEMAGWHHWLDGLESEWTPGVGDGQGGLACCDSWGGKESDRTERLTELNWEWEMLLEQQASSRENQRWTGVLNTLLYPGYREWVWGSCGSFADWIRHVYWGGGGREKSKANTFSLCGIGGETGYTAQEDLQSFNSYRMGEGRMIRVWIFHSCIPRPSLVLPAL